MTWLSEVWDEQVLTREVEEYLLRRGARTESYQELEIITWGVPYSPGPEDGLITHDPMRLVIEDATFQAKYGAPKGLDLTGWLACPVVSPKGKVIGFEARNTEKKALSEFLLPEAAWNPVWLGLCPSVMQRIWDGGDVWVVEGLFDLFPMQWLVPEDDVVLATLRARLTDKHVEFLRRFCQGWVHMVYDQDEQGRKATFGWTDQEGRRRWGALDKLKRVGLKCRDVPYSGGKDPGEIWDLGGARALRSYFKL